jgi:hypothetical protein
MTSSDISQEGKTIVVLLVCFPAILTWFPHIDIGEPPFQEPDGSIQKYMQDCCMFLAKYISLNVISNGSWLRASVHSYI